MTVDEAVRVERQGTTTVVTIDRPQRRNAVDGPTAQRLHEALLAFDAEDDQAVAVLTGAGGTFCAGADLSVLSSLNSPQEATTFIRQVTDVSTAIRQLPVPVLCFINGLCVGAGLEIAASCDIRAATRASASSTATRSST